MVKRHGSPSRSTIAAALVAAVLAVAVVSPAAADQGKARARKEHKTTYRSNRDHRSQRDYRSQRAPRINRDVHPRAHPRKWDSQRSERHHHTWNRSGRRHPIWADGSTRIYHHDRRPFYFHSGFDVFFGGDAFWFNVGNVPPHGYVYYDPHCHLPFDTVSAYRLHLRRHDHHALIDVIVADDLSYYGDPLYGDSYYGAHSPYYGEPVNGHGGCGSWDY